MIDFLKQSKTFDGLGFRGCYGMSLDTFKHLYDHYIECGENLLDAYSHHIYNLWERDNEYFELTPDDYSRYRSDFCKLRKLFVFNPEEIFDYKSILRRGIRNYYSRLREEEDNRRRSACAYTSRSDIKEAVFNRHGKSCISCGSSENITIDHIVPVSRGGKDEIKNLQPLCRSCNSKKGAMSNAKFLKINRKAEVCNG